MNITFRYAEKEDCPLILEFIRKMGVYEKAIDRVFATEELLEEWMFEKKYGEAVFVLADGKEVGISVFNEGFSDYIGKGILFIDELYVEEEYRGCGCGDRKSVV